MASSIIARIIAGIVGIIAFVIVGIIAQDYTDAAIGLCFPASILLAVALRAD